MRILLLLPLLLVGCTAKMSGKGTSVSQQSSNQPAPNPTPQPNPGPSPTPSPSNSDNMFETNVPWNQDITATAKDSQSDTIINWLNNNGGWGAGRMQVDFSFNILEMNDSTPMIAVQDHPDGYYRPDCEDGLSHFPMPAGGAIEGESGYTCAGDGDCHILVVDRVNKKLYESYRANLVNNQLQTMCAIKWDLTQTYSSTLRGDQCTSTDAAGFPIAPLLFTADEIAAGEIKHAIRFILPNARMQQGVYVRPATHAGGPSGPASAVPYGARFRLKSTFNVSSLKPAAQVVARAMQKYGMLLADGGNIALTAANDKYTSHKWAEVGFTALDLSSLKVTDFEMIEAGTRIPLTYDCVRN